MTVGPLLEVNGLSLAEYLDVQQEDGMDTYNPTFSEKVFSHSLLREGGTLALEDLKLKELIFPLLVRETSKPKLTQIVQNINRQINTIGAVVAWQDFGSEEPTYFDLSSGQFDIEYDYRKGQQNWVKGKLRLFVQPLGRKQKSRIIGTAAGTLPVIGIPITTASPLIGDVSAFFSATVAGNANQSFTAIAVLPAQYVPLYMAGGNASNAKLLEKRQIAPIATTITTDSTAVKSALHRFTVGATPVLVESLVEAMSRATPVMGEQRILALVRVPTAATSVPPGVLMRAAVIGATQSGQATIAITPTTAITPYASAATSSLARWNSWRTIDLGVVVIPTALANWSFNTQLYLFAAAPSGVATAQIDVTAAVMLPNSSFFLSAGAGPSAVGEAMTTLDARTRAVLRAESPEDEEIENLEPVMAAARGALPVLPVVSPTASLIAILQTGEGSLGALKTAAVVSAMERTRWIF